jgi:hypothetical protein
MVPQEGVMIPQEGVMVPQESIIVPQERGIAPQGFQAGNNIFQQRQPPHRTLVGHYS